jgi:hypothetical protein
MPLFTRYCNTAYNALRKLITDSHSDDAKLELFKQTLLKAFGATPEKAFAIACARSYNQSAEDVDAYATDLTQLVSAAFPHWSSIRRDELACRFFWKGLPQTPVTKQLIALFKQKRKVQGPSVPPSDLH